MHISANVPVTVITLREGRIPALRVPPAETQVDGLSLALSNYGDRHIGRGMHEREFGKFALNFAIFSCFSWFDSAGLFISNSLDHYASFHLVKVVIDFIPAEKLWRQHSPTLTVNVKNFKIPRIRFRSQIRVP